MRNSLALGRTVRNWTEVIRTHLFEKRMVRHIIPKADSESWVLVPWKKYRKILFRLQKRVWKAVRANDWRRARKLQKLILKSRSAQFLAVRQVSQLNQGRKTAGIDGKLALKHDERFELAQQLASHATAWQHQPLRQIPIPKKDGTTRMLKVPTIADRAWQCLTKYALEPAHEATFHAQSYGFRPGRGTWDAQKAIYDRLRGRYGLNKTILELDIEKCFDRIDHFALLRRTIAPQSIKGGLLRCLKAGANPAFPDKGTPQGGVVSPLLANIALNGVENIGAHRPYRYKPKRIVTTCVRYADDMVFALYPDQDPAEVLREVKAFLRDRGLKVKASKTHVVAATDGFNFLGWNFKVRSDAKLVCIPSVDNFKAFRKKVKAIVNSSNYGAELKAGKLAPLIRGWRNYHKYCNMSGSRLSLGGMQIRAFKRFNQERKLNRYSVMALIGKAFPTVGYKQFGHVKVKGNRSPFDGDVVYWSKRNSALYDGPTSGCLKRQHHTCGQCQLAFIDGERVHLHHIDGNHDNWARNNVVAVHQSCHNYIHRRNASSSPNGRNSLR